MFNSHRRNDAKCSAFALFLLLIALTLISSGQSLGAKTPEEQPTTATAPVATTASVALKVTLTSGTVQSRIDELSGVEGITPQQITDATKALRSAQAALEIADSQRQQAESYAKKSESVAEQTSDVQAETSRTQQVHHTDVPTTATAAQLERLRQATQTQLTTARTALRDLERESQRRTQRLADIPAARTKAESQVAEIESSRKEQAANAGIAQVREAYEIETQAVRQAFEATLAALDAELLWLTGATPLQTAQTDLAAAKVRAAEQQLAAQQAALEKARKVEAEREAAATKQAAEEAARAHPLLLEIARENERLAALRTGPESFVARLTATDRLIADLTSTTQALLDARDNITRRENLGTRADRAMAALLARYRSMIPDIAKSNARIRQREEEIATEQMRLLELDEERIQVRDIDGATQQFASRLNSETTGAARIAILEQARGLFSTRRTLLNDVSADAGRVFNRLIELQDVETRQVREAAALGNYIEERTLWLRTQRIITYKDVGKVLELAAVAFAPKTWLRSIRELAQNAPLESCLVAALLLMLLAAARIGRRRVMRLAETSQAGQELSIRHVLVVGTLTVAIAACGPLWAYLVGNLLRSPAHSSAVVITIGEMMVLVALIWFMFELIAEASRRSGLMTQVVGAEPDLVRDMHRSSRWLVWWLVPLSLMAGAFFTAAIDPQQTGAARVVSLISFTVLLAYAWKWWHPARGILARLWSQGGEPQFVLLRRFAFIAVLLSILTSMILVVIGYHPLARAIAWRALVTLWLAPALTIVYLFADALLRAARRRVARVLFERVKREQSEAVTTDEGRPAPDTGATALQVLERLRLQTQGVLKWSTFIGAIVALWMLWSGVLPALDVIVRQPLWTYTTQVPDPSAAAAVSATVDRVVPVRISDLLKAILIVVIAIVAGRNVPGLLDTMLLQRLRLDRGGRYALSTITGYAIGLVGALAAFNFIGIGWGDVQWLAAAVTVGLGFGLQEIFANFVSGIIILAERPVRVGDVVSVKGVDGIVTRIQMRATTITDWQRRDFIVPNKQIITGEVTNWTRTDRVTRLEFNVSVSPTANPDEVRELLLGIAAEQPDVMRNPAPHALLDTFGAWKQNFVMRCFLANNENGLAVRHAIMSRISEELKARNLNPL